VYNKVKRFPFYVILTAAFTLQLTLLDRIRILDAEPDLLLLLVAFSGVFYGWGPGLEAGVISGLLKDIFSTDIFGINTLALSITGFLIGGLSPKFFKESRVTQVFLVFIFSLVSMFIHYTLSSFLSDIRFIDLSEYLFGLIIPSAIYTSILSAIIFPVLMKKFRLKEQEDFV
jgi:rod shape-determining protein MreD